MPEPDKSKQQRRARSPKPGAGAPDQDNPADPIHEEAERLKSSTSADRAKRTHQQSTKRQPQTQEPDRPPAPARRPDIGD